jgi:hypothetical protein
MKLEAQFAVKREAHLNEVQDLKQQLDLKTNEVRNLNTSINELKNLNEELKVRALAHLLFQRLILPLLACLCGYISRDRRWQESG